LAERWGTAAGEEVDRAALRWCSGKIASGRWGEEEVAGSDADAADMGWSLTGEEEGGMTGRKMSLPKGREEDAANGPSRRWYEGLLEAEGGGMFSSRLGMTGAKKADGDLSRGRWRSCSRVMDWSSSRSWTENGVGIAAGGRVEMMKEAVVVVVVYEGCRGSSARLR
jgi:hypothetical protein